MRSFSGECIRRESPLYEGKIICSWFRESGGNAGEISGVLALRLDFSLFIAFDSVSGTCFIHILFTSGICPPGLRVQIRNRVAVSQEKTGILFCLADQKNLDAKSRLTVLPLSLVKNYSRQGMIR
jgi:hypothetical protein